MERSLIILLPAALSACDGSSNACGNDIRLLLNTTCEAAVKFAARDSGSISPTDTELHDYITVWSSAVAAEPLLIGRVPQTYRAYKWITLNLTTTNKEAISSWKTGKILTGDPALDASVSELSRPSVDPFFSEQADGSMSFSLSVAGLYNEEVLARRLAASNVWLPEPVRHSGDDGTWVWDGSVDPRLATVEFVLGWGDCLVACDGYHKLIIRSDDRMAVRVYDGGGDELPDGWELAPSTAELPGGSN